MKSYYILIIGCIIMLFSIVTLNLKNPIPTLGIFVVGFSIAMFAISKVGKE